MPNQNEKPKGKKEGRTVRGRMAPGPSTSHPIDPEINQNPAYLQALLQRGGKARAQLATYGIRLDVQAVPDINGNLDVHIGMSAQMLLAVAELLLDGLQSHIVEPFPNRVEDIPDPNAH